MIDLVRNLHHLDPTSLILLYNGGRDASLLRTGFPFERYNAVVHPHPRPMKWGWLHDFALDCFRFALENHPFDTMTIVDSDQLGTRAGYSEFLGRFLSGNPKVGLLGNVTTPRTPGPRAGPAEHAWKEVDLWRPFLRRFPEGESQFVHWVFWPSTVFTSDAARELVRLWEDPQLQDTLRRSRIWATEEVLFPTLTALLGFPVLQNPCRYDCVRYRVHYTSAQVDAALAHPEVFWMHPVPRQFGDPLRTRLRSHHGDYARPEESLVPTEPPAAEGERLLLTWPILAEMRKVHGWLSDEEADLLIATTARALSQLPDAPAVVEVGSFCGKATLVLGRVVQALGSPARIHAIDPLDGVVGARDQGLEHHGPTRERLERTLRGAGLLEHVRLHPQRAPEVSWESPIGLLLIDGLHDYASVSQDFHHLEPWVVTGGYVAFHDYADYFPGVKLLVQEVLRSGRFRRVHCAGSLLVLRKLAEAPRRQSEPAQAPRQVVAAPEPVAAAPVEPITASGGGAGPLVSCIMPTANRRPFIPLALRNFLQQDYPARELVIVDDGSDPIADLVPEDPRIRYVRVPQRMSLGAKRNLACREARGDIIVHWDDDDWSAAHRLRYQVPALLQARAAVCGVSRVFFHQPATGRSWQYVYPPGARPWMAGSSLCFTKDFWRGHPFPDINIGEDARFLWSDPNRPLVDLADNSFFVAMIHAVNTDPKRVEQRFWHPHPTEAIRTLMGESFEEYRRSFTGGRK
ncbi:Glycosyltransferase [Archangium gephyra]|uniref:Glycosyltransferase n=1 Tax=Archangium gephyra TaxID=48 RepID=A0AAC8TEE3_9BACT|nr:Glycosyltransferase [Archangium gephyra]